MTVTRLPTVHPTIDAIGGDACTLEVGDVKAHVAFGRANVAGALALRCARDRDRRAWDWHRNRHGDHQRDDEERTDQEDTRMSADREPFESPYDRGGMLTSDAEDVSRRGSQALTQAFSAPTLEPALRQLKMVG